ncbi:MAG TPA: hypothetical protein VGM92_02715 [Candidatus Kapabacteria bacterium]
MTIRNTEGFDDLDRSIERFLSHEMPEAERASFQEFLVLNPEASELLTAEVLIQQFVSHASIPDAHTASAGPSPFLMNYFAGVQRSRKWIGWIALAGLLIALGFFFYSSTGSKAPATMPPNVTPAPKTLVNTFRDVAPNNAQVAPEQPSMSGGPNLHSVSKAQKTTGNAGSPKANAVAAAPIAVHHFDEPLGEPKTFVKDSASVLIHSK